MELQSTDMSIKAREKASLSVLQMDQQWRLIFLLDLMEFGVLFGLKCMEKKLRRAPTKG